MLSGGVLTDVVKDGAIKAENKISEHFDSATEGSRNWSIRFGAEPIDLHLTGKGTQADKFLENKAGITAGVGSVFNHNYIEVVNPDGQVTKRVHGIGLDQNWQMTGSGRLVGFVTDGKYTKFSDDPLQKDDPHATKQNQLQHADEDGYTKTVFRGNERQVLQLYGGLVQSTIEINRQNSEFGLLGQKNPNSNSYNAEMKEKLNEMTDRLGIRVESHNAPGWDIGSDFDMKTESAKTISSPSLAELRKDVDQLEQTAAQQLTTLKQNIKADLQPAPSLNKPN